MSSSEIDEGPSQKEFDFNKQIIDEQWLNEHQMIHEESEKINEHGLGIFLDNHFDYINISYFQDLI
jgi:hypothetical protein